MRQAGIILVMCPAMSLIAPLVHLIFEKWNGLSKPGVESEG